MIDADKLKAASEVVVIRGAGFNPKRRGANERLAVERDPDAGGQLAGLLCDVVLKVEGAALMEWPEVSFVFRNRREVLDEVGLLSGGRWARHGDQGDFKIRRPEDIGDWLRSPGIDR